MSFRLVIHPKMDGRLSMALDEVLLDAVGGGNAPQTIRLYGFSPPTLSLGRFQPARGMLDAEALKADGVCLVRRPTGGHAVFHNDELTYSVAVPKAALEGSIGSHRKRAVYDYFAGMLLAGLSALGIEACVNSRQVGDPRNPDCFASSGEYEIMDASGRKLVGSAQTTTRTAVLQQGSIPITFPAGRVLRYLRGLELPERQREPSCLSEAAGRALGFGEVQAAFAAALRKGFDARDGELTAEETAAARRLAADKYGTDEWNLRA